MIERISVADPRGQPNPVGYPRPVIISALRWRGTFRES